MPRIRIKKGIIMNIIEIIEKKRDGGILSKEEIKIVICIQTHFSIIIN